MSLSIGGRCLLKKSTKTPKLFAIEKEDGTDDIWGASSWILIGKIPELGISVLYGSTAPTALIELKEPEVLMAPHSDSLKKFASVSETTRTMKKMGMTSMEVPTIASVTASVSPPIESTSSTLTLPNEFCKSLLDKDLSPSTSFGVGRGDVKEASGTSAEELPEV